MKENNAKPGFRKKVELINALLEEVLEKAHQGCPIATEKLCKGIAGLVSKKVDSMIRTYPGMRKLSILDRDDMLQISWMTCLNLVKKKPLKGKYFSIRSVFRAAIQCALLNAYKARIHKRQTYLTEEWDQGFDVDFIRNINQDYLRTLYKKFMHLLTEKEAYVIKEHFYRERKLADIAEDLQITKERVSMLKAAGLKRLRKEIMNKTGAKRSKDLM